MSAADHVSDKGPYFSAIVHGRKSVRAFLPDPLPQKLIRELLALASWAPSNCNTQPWMVHVASGDTIVRLTEELTRDSAASGITPEVPYNAQAYPAALQTRMVEHLGNQQHAFGIAREDKDARNKLRDNNLRFFGAPHVVFVYMPDFGNEREAADIGMFAQTFMLALEAHGLAGVPQTSVGMYAAPIRRVLNPSPNHKLLFTISFGREDVDARGARLVQERTSVDQFAVFHE
ncbi:Nitroreductase NfnB [Pseudomonas sp. 9AZ]|uniref:nitroreductase n=1 Tax=Pseudomonas sp. 9AZ TaxID=2653168 RepID=UPI0012F01AC1|nr:nitroreductase [Pseudomonas sp. 9AZ]VXD04447.1 Nitroreductase NfnB [Pseudomonas sp. 9AZ]